MRITDPSNRYVILPSFWRQTSGKTILRLADCQKIIETPSGMIRTKDDHLFYFRAINKKSIGFVKVVKEETDWVVVDCQTNLAPEAISSLLEKGEFTPGVLLGIKS